MVAAPNETPFRKLARALGHGEWLDDRRFATKPARVENRAALDAELRPIFGAGTRAGFQATLEAAGVPCAPALAGDDRLLDEV